MKLKLKFALQLILILLSTPILCQEGETIIDENSNTTIKQKGFHAGIYVGAFWANHNTANLYDGYGFDEICQSI